MKLFLIFTTLFVVIAQFTAASSSSYNGNKVSWYMPGTTGSETLKWFHDAATIINKPAVATGVYYCCNEFEILANGNFQQNIPDCKIEDLVQPLKQQNFSIHFVMGINTDSVLNRTWQNTSALAQLAKAAAQFNFDGFLVDYEPSKDYTDSHKQAYADFLSALSKSMHSVGKQSGFDSAGWGILDAWSYYRRTDVDICTSMTPTYNYLPPNAEPLKKFVLAETNPISGMPIKSVGAGIGTTLAPGIKPEWDYHWTQPTLTAFASWLKSPAANVTRMDFWRADIDSNLPASSTATWVLESAAMFLGY